MYCTVGLVPIIKPVQFGRHREMSSPVASSTPGTRLHSPLSPDRPAKESAQHQNWSTYSTMLASSLSRRREQQQQQRRPPPPSTDWPTMPVLNFDSPFPPQPPSPGMGGPAAWPGPSAHSDNTAAHQQTPPAQPSTPTTGQDAWKETKGGQLSGSSACGHFHTAVARYSQ